MNRKYSDEFKVEAVKQVIERGYSGNDVSKRLDISIKSLYVWLKESRDSNGKGDSLAMISSYVISFEFTLSTFAGGPHFAMI